MTDDITFTTALNMARKICVSTPSDVEDIANEAYFEYLRGDKEGKTILYRRVIDALRKLHGHKNADGVPTKLKRRQDTLSLDERICGDLVTSKEYMDSMDIQDFIDSIFITKKTKIMFTMKINGYTIQEISEAMQTSEANVRTTLTEASRVAEIALEKEEIGLIDYLGGLNGKKE